MESHLFFFKLFFCKKPMLVFKLKRKKTHTSFSKFNQFYFNFYYFNKLQYIILKNQKYLIRFFINYSGSIETASLNDIKIRSVSGSVSFYFDLIILRYFKILHENGSWKCMVLSVLFTKPHEFFQIKIFFNLILND